MAVSSIQTALGGLIYTARARLIKATAPPTPSCSVSSRSVVKKAGAGALIAVRWLNSSMVAFTSRKLLLSHAAQFRLSISVRIAAVVAPSSVCYLCGRQWKTCRCPQWEERRLYDSAVEIDQRRNGPRKQPQVHQ
ncbi:hypothetical protein F5Y15DRAFT_373975 [Xylariaceae sp. FL0016]|nr:hypothetical protein F5Y15DRAFT_373975 [Xylariaceae sp. FL0016]